MKNDMTIVISNRKRNNSIPNKELKSILYVILIIKWHSKYFDITNFIFTSAYLYKDDLNIFNRILLIAEIMQHGFI